MPAKKAGMRKSATVWAVREPLKAVKIELSHKRIEEGLSKVLGGHFFEKGVLIVNPEGFSIWSERYDVGVSLTLHFCQHSIELSGKRLCLAVSTIG
jgi:hypothetical protein